MRITNCSYCCFTSNSDETGGFTTQQENTGSSSPHKTRQILPFFVAFTSVDLEFDVLQRILVVLLLLGHLQLGCILSGWPGPRRIVRITPAIWLTTRPLLRLPVTLRLCAAFVRSSALLLLVSMSGRLDSGRLDSGGCDRLITFPGCGLIAKVALPPFFRPLRRLHAFGSWLPARRPPR